MVATPNVEWVHMKRDKEIERIANIYRKYLNGPLGIGVMTHLKEGESFTISSQDERVSISKIEEKAVVKVLREKNQPEVI